MGNKNRNHLSLDSSILYRCSQKYFDKSLDGYGLGYAHVIFLTAIYESEGISMNELASRGSFDKGTITKSIQKLHDNGYVRIENDLDDKRKKLLYTTDKSHEIMSFIYKSKNNWYDYLCQDLNVEEFKSFINYFDKILNRCIDYNITLEKKNDFKIFGLNKISFNDYPNHLCCTLFTGGCNFRCPYCNKKDLVFLNENLNDIPATYIFEYLSKRNDMLDAVCITGGEPLLNDGLIDFIKDIRRIGLKVKLDTNGYCFDKLKYLIDNHLIDYISMDLKNCLSKYCMTTGLNNLDLNNIRNSVNYIMCSNIEYEFNTTLVKEFHSIEDLIEITIWLKDAKKYYLQTFINDANCINNSLTSYSKEEMLDILNELKEYNSNVMIKGME